MSPLSARRLAVRYQSIKSIGTIEFLGRRY